MFFQYACFIWKEAAAVESNVIPHDTSNRETASFFIIHLKTKLISVPLELKI